MGKWFWRWLCFFAGICLTAACGQSPSARSDTPSPTLLRFTPSSASLPVGPMIRPPMTATPLRNLPLLTLTGLNCYETPVQSLVCSGWIHNSLDVPYEHLLLQLKLVADDGEVVASLTTTPVRDWLPPQSGTPYRFIFNELPSENVTPQVALLGADETGKNSALEIQNLKAVWDGTMYRISGRVNNKSPASGVKVIVTVQNANGKVIGFRTLIQTENNFETTIILSEPYADSHRVVATADKVEEY